MLLDAHRVPFCGDGDVTHLDVLFAAVAPDGVRPRVSEESLDVRWWPVDDVPEADVASFAAWPGGGLDGSVDVAGRHVVGGGSSLAAADQPTR